jgi:hypothetical protein
MGKIKIFEDFLEIETPALNSRVNDYNAVDKDEKDFLKNFILNTEQAPF